MPVEIWLVIGGACVLVFGGGAFLWHRKPMYRWYCRRCRKIVSCSRRRPMKHTCGTHSLVAYFCQACRGWNTSPTATWHCDDCKSKEVKLGVEYRMGTSLWTTRNRNG